MQLIRPESRQPIPPNAKKLFDGVIFEIYQWEQVQFDGSIRTFEKAKRKLDSVNVLVVTKEGKIILTKQEQPGETPFVGCLGGRIEEGEDPIQCAKREMLEESGISANKFELFFALQPILKTDWAIYNFIAKDLTFNDWIHEDVGGEKIELIEVTFDEFLDLLTQDNFRDDEIALHILKAKSNPQKFAEIKKLFSPY